MTEETTPMEASKKHDNLESRRSRNWFARYSLTLIIVCTFLALVGLLFFAPLPQEARDLLNILLGAYVAVLAKATDYWFKEKEDPEVTEAQKLHDTESNGNGIA
jgi:hypothetical protein|tara:strand:- start:339 stop:650 length:312 start_codon:yes stop_codon:yes gene_type:complete